MSDTFLLLLLLVTPCATGVLCLIAPSVTASERISVAGSIATGAVVFWVAVDVARHGSFQAVRGLAFVDSLSALLAGTIAVVSLAGALVSVNFIRIELDAGRVPQKERGVRFYYAGYHALVATMLFTVSVDSLGLLWVGIEATTVVSALLVGFSRSRAALEAAWKYVILCTVGITCALFGVMLTYFAARAGADSGSLDWISLAVRANDLDPALMRLAFVFVLVGFGTKAGFAPLHTWMADAYGQAPAPVSGVLSGALSVCALYGVLRFHSLTTAATGSEFSGQMLVGFGVFSVLVAAPFILLARDFKRLFAFSSVEHIGLMAIAFGIGGPLGIAAGALHLINHAATKALLFFVGGGVRQRYGTRRISGIRGLTTIEPLLGWLFIGGVLAITGAPPFGMFVSELAIAGAAFDAGGWILAAVIATLLALGVIFAGFMRHAISMGWGVASQAATAPTLADRTHGRGASIVAMVALLSIMLLLGLHVPEPVRALFDDITRIIEPGHPEVAAR